MNHTKYRAWRPFVLAALAAVLAGCGAAWERAMAPAHNPWPTSTDGRVRRDGRVLRVFCASLRSHEESDADARKHLERWLWRLQLGDELEERKALIQAVMDSREAKPVPSPTVEKSGFSSIIELDLPTLNRKLETYYD
jgi:hypothetical protein